MSKKKKHKKQSFGSKWGLPENYIEFFDSSSDEKFRAAHPVGYFFLVILEIAVLVFPAILFYTFAKVDSAWILLGTIGGLVFGLGIFNIVAIIINQYLGRWVSIICFSIGSVMMLISCFLGK